MGIRCTGIAKLKILETNEFFQVKPEIQRDIVTRHDLVHRNGKTEKGHEVLVDEVVVDEVINRIKNFVDELDQQLKDKYKSQ